MRFLPVLSALLLITGSGLATARPDAAGSPSAAPAPAATPSTGAPAPTPPVGSVPAIPPTIIRLPAPAKSPANTRPPAPPAETAQAGQQADLAGGPAQAPTLTTFEVPESLQPSLETVLQAVTALEKRLDALETAIHQLSAQNQAGAPVNKQIPQPSPTVTSSPPAAADTVYVVQPGDTLNSLAARFAVERRRLIEFNRLETPDILSVGQRLRIPPEGSPHRATMSPFREAQ